MKGNTQLRQESLKKVLTEIRKSGPVSKRELQKITGFSWGNISSIITLLCDSGYIVSAGKQDTGIGRKPDEYDINIDNNFIIGVDFSSAWVFALVCDLRGRIVKEFKVDIPYTKACRTREFAQKLLFKIVGEAVEFCNGKNVSYIAVAMQGDVDTVNGISVNLSSIDKWENVPVCQMLEEKFNVKTVMLHDPDCVIYAERFYGALADDDINNAVEIRFEHGLGIAAILDGKIYKGNNGRTCEIRKMLVPSKNEDGYNSLTEILGGMENLTKAYYKAAGDKVSFEALGELARNGNKHALEIFNEVITALAFALSNVCALYNPDKIVIFGELNKVEDLIIDCLEGLISELMEEDEIIPKIEISKLDYTAAAVGAALFAADYMIEQLYFEK